MAAMAIGAGIMAVSSIAAAKKASSASKAAAKTQADSANRSADLAANMYRQQYTMQSPYMMLGNSAANTLGRLMGSPAGAKYASEPLYNQPYASPSPMPMAGGPFSMGPGGFATPRRAPMSGGGTLGQLAMMR